MDGGREGWRKGGRVGGWEGGPLSAPMLVFPDVNAPGCGRCCWLMIAIEIPN